MAAESCKAKTKDGQRCKAPASRDGLCYFHAHPEQARILGQKGGRKNRRPVAELKIPEDMSATGLGTFLEQAMAELLNGRLQPRAATALAQLVNARRHLERRSAQQEDSADQVGSVPDCNAEGKLGREQGIANGQLGEV